jgi:hypothetical protein
MQGTNRLASKVSIWLCAARHLATVVAVASCALVLGVSGGCVSRGGDAVSVAQVAVRANPDLELLATDERQAVLTVRVRRTGRVMTVRADDVVAGSAFRDLNASAATPGPQATAGPDAAPPSVAPTPSAAASSAPTSAPPAASAPASASRRVEASTPGASVSISRPSSEARKQPAAAPVEPAPRRETTPETPTGTASTERAAPAQARSPEQVSPAATPRSAPPSSSSRQAGANIDESRLERRKDPVRCIGSETIRLDGVLLEADRVAVEALGKCAVHITNSRVVGRVALQVAGDSNVKIENSIIEGSVAIQASQTATVEAHASTIRGRVRKLQSGEVKDLGENVWR